MLCLPSNMNAYLLLQQGGYTTLDNTTLQNRVDAAAGRIAELCCMPIGEAARLLHAFKWCAG